MKKSYRERWVDIAKGIAIIAVVYAHISFKYPEWRMLPILDLLANSWHVAVFFLIGGFFIKEEKLQSPLLFVKGKFKSIYLLILYLYIPTLLLHNWFLNIGFYDIHVNYYGKYVTEWGAREFLTNLLMAIFFAGREPLLGAMWFVYVLFMALCILTFISYCLKKSIKNEGKYEFIRCYVFFTGAILSCTATKVFDFTIPRANNTIVAVWLIYFGMLLKNRWKLKFNNIYAVAFSGILLYHSTTIWGGVSLVANDFVDVINLTIVSASALYIICYLSKKLEMNVIGKILGKLGENSFYIMGLHFIGFKIFSLCLGMECQLADLVPSVGGNFILLVGYLLFGLLFPITVVFVVRESISIIKYTVSQNING